MADAVCEPLEKRGRLECFMTTDDDSDSGESTHTWQGYETAWVKDSGDDWSPSSTEDSDSDDRNPAVVYEVEYEVATDSDSSHSFLDSDGGSSSTDVEEVILPIIAATTYKIELECPGDTEDSEEGIIRTSPVPPPPVLHADRWKCLRCGVLNMPPMRYCDRCYKLRKDWLPDRPKGKNRKRHLDQQPDSEDIPPSSSSTFSLSGSQPADSGVESQSGSQASSNGMEQDDNCLLCFVRPRDGTIVHGKSGHRRYCYTCAKKIWRKKIPCPFCRKKIEKVIKDFDVECGRKPFV